MCIYNAKSNGSRRHWVTMKMQPTATASCMSGWNWNWGWAGETKRSGKCQWIFLDIWQQATKGKWSKLLKATANKKEKNTTPPVAKNYVQPTFITLFHFSFLCKGFQNVFLVRKPKCATCANFLQFFLAANFIGFHKEEWQKNFRSISC